MNGSSRSGTHPVTRPGAYSLTARDVPRPWLRLVDVQSEIVADRHAEAKPRPRKCASKPTGDVVATRTFNSWYVVCELVAGWLRVKCLCCSVVFERTKHSIVSGESKMCCDCAAKLRKVG